MNSVRVSSLNDGHLQHCCLHCGRMAKQIEMLFGVTVRLSGKVDYEN